MTSSFLSELVIPLRDHLRLRRPSSYLVVANLAEKVSEELDELLTRSQEAVLCCVVPSEGVIAEPHVLGQLDHKLRETFDLVVKRGETTAVQLHADSGESNGIGATAWNICCNKLKAVMHRLKCQQTRFRLF